MDGEIKDEQGTPIARFTVPDDADQKTIEKASVRARIVYEAEQQGVPVPLALGLGFAENRFRAHGRSEKGAMGPLQMMPDTAKEMGVDPTIVGQNIRGGVAYLKQQLDTFKTPDLALAAYNAGPGAVRSHGGIPPYKETQDYVRRALKYSDHITRNSAAAAARVAAPAPPEAAPQAPGSVAAADEAPVAPAEPLGLLERVADATPEIAGSTAGSLVGRSLGAPLGPLGAMAGDVVGAGIGGGLGAGIKTLAETQDFRQAAQEAVGGATRQAVTSAAFGAAGKVLGTGYRVVRPYLPFLGAVEKSAADAVQFFGTYAQKAKRGVVAKVMGKAEQAAPILAPAEITGSGAWNLLERLARSSSTGAEKLRSVTQAGDAAILAAQNDVLDQFGRATTPKEVGELVQEVVRGNADLADAAVAPGFNALREVTAPTMTTAEEIVTPAISREVSTGLVDQAGKAIMRTEVTPAVTQMVERPVGGVKVVVKDAKRFAEPLRKMAADLGGMAGASTADNVVADVDGLATGLTWEVASELRTRLGYMLKQAKRAGYKTIGTGRIKHLYGKISGAMEEGLQAFNPELVPAWRALNRQVAQNKDLYENAGLVKLMKLGTAGSVAGTERFAQAVFRPGEATGAARLMEAVGTTAEGAGLREKLKWTFTHRLFSESLGEGGMVDGVKLLRNLRSAEHYGETAKAVLTAPERQRLVQYGTHLKRFQDLRRDAPGGESFGLMRAAAIVGVLSGTLPPKAAAILIAPNVAARMVTSPAIFRMLTEGARPLSASSRALAQLSGRLGVEVVRLDNQEREDDARRAEAWQTPAGPTPMETSTPTPKTTPRPTMTPFRVAPRGARPGLAGRAR